MRHLEELRQFASIAAPVLCVAALLAFLQSFAGKGFFENWKQMAFFIFLAVIGLYLFISGAEGSLIPLADSAGSGLARIGGKFTIVIIGFVIGYFATLLEPALKIFALQIETEFSGAISKTLLTHTVAVGFACGMALGMAKILWTIDFKIIAVPLISLLLLLIIIAPKSIASISLDCSGAVTGPVNIPINMALSLGLARIYAGSDPVLHGFGLIGFTALGAAISLLIVGTIVVKGI